MPALECAPAQRPYYAREHVHSCRLRRTVAVMPERCVDFCQMQRSRRIRCKREIACIIYAGANNPVRSACASEKCLQSATCTTGASKSEHCTCAFGRLINMITIIRAPCSLVSFFRSGALINLREWLLPLLMECALLRSCLLEATRNVWNIFII